MPLVTINQSLREKLKDHKIIPEVVDDFIPTALLSIEYPKGNTEVSLGNTISPDDTQELPTIRITPDGVDNASYTVVLTDPDAPSRKDPKWSEFCHWIVTGLRAPSLEELSAAQTAEATSIDVSKGSQIVDYMGPAPPPKTGKHRYVFLLYKSGNGDHIEGPSDRKRWGNDESREGVRKWAKKYDLELIVAINLNWFVLETIPAATKILKSWVLGQRDNVIRDCGLIVCKMDFCSIVPLHAVMGSTGNVIVRIDDV